MKNQYSILYLFLGIYSVMINWHYNHSVFYAILSWIFWGFYLIYAILTGNLANGQWQSIPAEYFK